MSDASLIPIRFGGLCLNMKPYFFEKDKEKIKYVDVDINFKNEVLYRFQLRTQVEPIDTQSEGQHSTDVEGEMYLDLSLEKIIFEGFYYENGKLKGPFWLEVDPNSEYSEILSNFDPPTVDCPEYPASVGTLAISITPPTPAVESTSNNDSSQMGVTIKVIQLEPTTDMKTGNSGETTYLLTTLYQNNRITGVDTTNKDEKHFPDFSGDVGIIRNRAYVDGHLKLGGKSVSGIYLEMGI
ncbi:MAG: hypothetical protein Q8942_06155 [Bacillota bacterium]|nr:hypothetical protein [Bacillota bacterium]